MRQVIFPQDELDRVRGLLGEDTSTGLVPVEEATVEQAATFESPPDTPATLELAPYAKGGHRLGAVPCEVLNILLPATFGEDWYTQEVPVLLEMLARSKVILDPGGWSKVMAIRTMLGGPSWRHPFYTSWRSFCFLACSLLGRPVRWNQMCSPSPVEACLALWIALELRPLPVEDEVIDTLAALCLADGLWALPQPLSMAQASLYALARYEDLPISADMVDSVLRRVKQLQEQEASLDSPLLLDPDEDSISPAEQLLRSQTIRCYEVVVNAEDLHAKAQQYRERVEAHLTEAGIEL